MYRLIWIRIQTVYRNYYEYLNSDWLFDKIEYKKLLLIVMCGNEIMSMNFWRALFFWRYTLNYCGWNDMMARIYFRSTQGKEGYEGRSGWGYERNGIDHTLLVVEAHFHIHKGSLCYFFLLYIYVYLIFYDEKIKNNLGPFLSYLIIIVHVVSSYSQNNEGASTQQAWETAVDKVTLSPWFTGHHVSTKAVWRRNGSPSPDLCLYRNLLPESSSH